MTGIYFSGTGNTKHCVEMFVKGCERESEVVPIDAPHAEDMLAKDNVIVFGYPVYYSNLPKIVKDFMERNKEGFAGKKIFIIATMGLFSGDGTGCAARFLQKCGAQVVGGLHLKMPDCIGDEKALKKPIEKNRELVKKADAKIAAAVAGFKNGAPTREGLGVFSHLAGLFGQRLWFYGKTAAYKEKPVVDEKKCIGCGLCTTLCPMQNIAIEKGKAVAHKRCTLCYRCFSRCPTKALTILGKRVYEQCLFEKYQ